MGRPMGSAAAILPAHVVRTERDFEIEEWEPYLQGSPDDPTAIEELSLDHNASRAGPSTSRPSTSEPSASTSTPPTGTATQPARPRAPTETGLYRALMTSRLGEKSKGKQPMPSGADEDNKGSNVREPGPSEQPTNKPSSDLSAEPVHSPLDSSSQSGPIGLQSGSSGSQGRDSMHTGENPHGGQQKASMDVTLRYPALADEDGSPRIVPTAVVSSSRDTSFEDVFGADERTVFDAVYGGGQAHPPRRNMTQESKEGNRRQPPPPPLRMTSALSPEAPEYQPGVIVNNLPSSISTVSALHPVASEGVRPSASRGDRGDRKMVLRSLQKVAASGAARAKTPRRLSFGANALRITAGQQTSAQQLRGNASPWVPANPPQHPSHLHGAPQGDNGNNPQRFLQVPFHQRTEGAGVPQQGIAGTDASQPSLAQVPQQHHHHHHHQGIGQANKNRHAELMKATVTLKVTKDAEEGPIVVSERGLWAADESAPPPQQQQQQQQPTALHQSSREGVVRDPSHPLNGPSQPEPWRNRQASILDLGEPGLTNDSLRNVSATVIAETKKRLENARGLQEPSTSFGCGQGTSRAGNAGQTERNRNPIDAWWKCDRTRLEEHIRSSLAAAGHDKSKQAAEDPNNKGKGKAAAGADDGAGTRSSCGVGATRSGTGTQAFDLTDTEIDRLSVSMEQILTQTLTIIHEYARDNVHEGRGMFREFRPPPEWSVDASPAGRMSFFGEDHGAPPQRVGRDPRYRNENSMPMQGGVDDRQDPAPQRPTASTAKDPAQTHTGAPAVGNNTITGASAPHTQHQHLTATPQTGFGAGVPVYGTNFHGPQDGRPGHPHFGVPTGHMNHGGDVGPSGGIHPLGTVGPGHAPSHLGTAGPSGPPSWMNPYAIPHRDFHGHENAMGGHANTPGGDRGDFWTMSRPYGVYGAATLAPPSVGTGPPGFGGPGGNSFGRAGGQMVNTWANHANDPRGTAAGPNINPSEQLDTTRATMPYRQHHPNRPFEDPNDKGPWPRNVHRRGW